MTDTVAPDLVTVALASVGGHRFERFAQAFFAAQLDAEFVPLGGMHDGGADGVFYDSRDALPSRFMQASIVPGISTKIRDTVKTLRDNGREPTELVFASSHDETKIDLLERRLSQELAVSIRIYGRSYFALHINDSALTRAAYRHHLAAELEPLLQAGRSLITPSISHYVQSPTVYVFLRQELDRRGGDTSVVDALVEGLVLWALEGTDPDLGILMSRHQIQSRVVGELPALSRIFEERLDAALTALADKRRKGGRAVRWYQKEDLFCLPHEERQRIQEANARDEALLHEVLDQFQRAAADLLGDTVGAGVANQCALLARRVVDRLFEQQGMEFAEFILHRQGMERTPSVPDALESLLPTSGVAAANYASARDVVPKLLRKAFYEPTVEQRDLFDRLSRTYCLLFALQAEPQVARYLDDLKADFVLLVGADMLIRAMAEDFVPESGRMIRTALRMVADAGAELVLTEPVVEEVVRHLRASNHEFQQHFGHLERELEDDLAAFSDKILVRAYIHARFSTGIDRPPDSWRAYLNRFCTPDILQTERAFSELRDYLQTEFHMRYQSRKELEELVERRSLEELAARVGPEKQHEQLAVNDALLVLSVYGRRVKEREVAGTSPFGHRTWWLTGEVAIKKHTRELVEAHHGEPYIMRPEFLVNVIGLAPSAAQVRRTYRTVFPSVLGIRLSRRVKAQDVRRILSDLDAARGLSEARRAAAVRSAVNELKSRGPEASPSKGK